jgi:hypothetical protein
MPSLFDLNQYRHLELYPDRHSNSLGGVLTVSEIIKSQAISRRGVLSLFGKVAVFGAAASTAALTISDAEAQTTGMERRQERRAGTTTGTGAGTTTGAAK